MDEKGNDVTSAATGECPAEQFQSRLLACWQSIDALVIELAAHYDLVVILRALAEHTGTGLLALANHRGGGALQARHLIGRIEEKAFRSEVGGVGS